MYKSLIKRNHQVIIFKVHDNVLTRSKCGCKSKYLLRTYSSSFFVFWSGSVVPSCFISVNLLVSKEKMKVWVSDFVFQMTLEVLLFFHCQFQIFWPST